MAEELGDSSDRTEEATPQRREEFRRQGQVAMTRELAPSLSLLGGALLIWALGHFYFQQVSSLYKEIFSHFVLVSGKQGDFAPAIKFAGLRAVFILTPAFLVFGALAIASTVMQVGLLSNTDAINFNFEKLNPVSGFRRLMSLRAIVEGVKSLLKVSLVGILAFLLIKSEFLRAPHLVEYSTEQLMQYLGAMLVKILFAVGMMMAVLAALDYGYQWWDLEKRMRMTKQEVKEEIKSREGNPQIKARIRRIQRDLAQKRMMDAVPKADVIITNPTHIAIALKYDANLPAPQIVAKGADLIAEKIKEIARQHNIPIVENKPLARTIFKTIKIGQVIPRELFNAVAEVLAYVYRLKKRTVR